MTTPQPPGNGPVLIAGCGYLGHRVAHRWVRHRHVHAITRSVARSQEFLQGGLSPIVADLAQAEIPELPDVDTVLWAVGFDRSTGVSREAIWIDGLTRLIRALPKPPTRFIYVSSTSVYGDSDGQPVDEFTAVSPQSDGGETCLRAECLLRQQFAHHRDTHVAVLRMAGIYGPGRLLRRVDDLRAQLPVTGRPDHFLNLIHVDDAVHMIDCASRATVWPDVVNVVNTESLTRMQYYTELARLTNSPPPQFKDALQPGNSSADSRRVRGGNKQVVSSVRKDLGVEFQFDSVRRGLSDAVSRSTL